MVNKMNYGIILKRIRLSNNITQIDLAKMLGIARITYSHYETQEKIIPLERLVKLCNYFNVSIDYILGLDKNNNYKKLEINKYNIGKNLKSFRKERKITQEKLAKILNTTHSVISEYENGKNLISTSFLYTICFKYKISANYFLS